MIKRALDVAVSALFLLVLSPLLLTLWFVVRWRMGKPAIFCQRRPGLGGRPFTLYKFRTMNNVLLPDGTLRPDAERLTSSGKVLRATSLDELPQLWNVLRGDMSLVGPRPLLMEYLDRYSPEQARRLEAKPGITGWSQVNGRNALSWEEKFALDVWYVDHWSVGLDLRILLKTGWRVLCRDGISAASHATMPVFTGTILTHSADQR
jgi:lipopolysaccharide/colanic/teichoic acid biosynthesis glycosyltransferase